MINILVAYDIKSNKRRTKLCNLLKDYGLHIQFSVFEIEADSNELQILIDRIKNIIDKKEDSVKIYYLSGNKNKQSIELGNSKFIYPDNVIIF